MPQLVVIVHNVRSAHNVGSILRSADGLGVAKVYLSGYSPYPKIKADQRLPHIATKVEKRISKTSLGAELSVDWEQTANISRLIRDLKRRGFLIAALEQTADSISLFEYRPIKAVALILGQEIGGVDKPLLASSDLRLEIPMSGRKDSLNVSVAAAIAMYHFKVAGSLGR